MSADEEDKRDKLGPTISYLQKLGGEYLTQIFDASRWVLETDRDMGFEVIAYCILHVLEKEILIFLLFFLVDIHLRRATASTIQSGQLSRKL